jgi:septum formation topological specificity factor MinE
MEGLSGFEKEILDIIAKYYSYDQTDVEKVYKYYNSFDKTIAAIKTTTKYNILLSHPFPII